MSNYPDNDAEVIELLRELIRIPSWVSGSSAARTRQNENKIVEFLEYWLENNTSLEIVRQPLPEGRFNLIARKGEPSMVWLAHTDTVSPSEGAPYDMFAAEIHDGSIWGLGSTDMKSGIAAMLQAIKLTPNANNFWLFLYADEEYDFLGMKWLVSELSSIRPNIIISSDGADLKLGYGCRGCIELRMRARGTTGHAAKGNGTSAITGSRESLAALQKWLLQFLHPKMGKVSLNEAFFLGGTLLPNNKSFSPEGLLVSVGQHGNKIADIAEFVIDIRPVDDELRLETVVDFLSQELRSRGLIPTVVQKTHDLGVWYTMPDRLESYVQIAQQVVKRQTTDLDHPGNCGYLDLQMLWNATGRPDAFMFGGGVGKTAHTPEEHIPISNLLITRDFFRKVLGRHQSC
ncbi:M20 family peptidase [Candidatus Microgenomates bacterium]|nr:MAG: M20 family peptidase [Candidatus Microgenomates bacterium]